MRPVCCSVCNQITLYPPVNWKVASKAKNTSAQLSLQMVMAVTNYHFGSLVDLENFAASKRSIWTILTSNKGSTMNARCLLPTSKNGWGGSIKKCREGNFFWYRTVVLCTQNWKICLFFQILKYFIYLQIPHLNFSLVMLVSIVRSKHIIVGISINGYCKILRMALRTQWNLTHLMLQNWFLCTCKGITSGWIHSKITSVLLGDYSGTSLM